MRVMTRNYFEGDKVRLRAIEPEDWETFSQFELDSELARLAGSTRFPRSRAAAREWAEEASKRSNGDRIDLVIETINGTAIGAISVREADRRHGVFSYAIAIAQEHRRKGYGTQAVWLLLRHYFRELRYNKVEVGIYSFNEESIYFHESLGFQHEGRRRQSHYSEGRYYDMVLMGMTVQEFLSSTDEVTE